MLIAIVFLLLFVGLLAPGPLLAQPVSTGFPQVNDPTIGTVANKLAKITPAGAVLAAETDKNEPLYVVLSDAGKTGQAFLQQSGVVRCVMDTTASNTRGMLVVAGKDGACHPIPATPLPTGFVVGQVQDNSTTADAKPGAVISTFQLALASAGTGPAPTPTDVLKPCAMETGSKSSTMSAIPADDDMTNVCGNWYGMPWSVVGFACKTDGGTVNVTPLLSGGSDTSMVSAPVVCGPEWNAGAITGTPKVLPFAADRKTCPTAPCTVDVRINTVSGATRLQWSVLGMLNP